MTIALLAVSLMLKGNWKKLDLRTWFYVGISGLLLGFVANALYYFGLKYISGTMASVLMLLTPLAVFLLSAEYLKEGFKAKTILGLLVAGVGALLVVISASNGAFSFAQSSFNSGVIAVLIGGFLAALGTVLAKPALNKATAQQETFIRIFCAWAGYTIATLITGDAIALGSISSTGWLTIILSTVIVVTATATFHSGLKGISGEEAGLLDYLRPVFGVVASIIILNEQLNPLFVLGAIMVFFGTYITEVKVPLRLHSYHHHH